MTAPAYGIDVQGHRGARGLLPENTLPAFARALELGVTTLELDCAVTSDGVVVVSHDLALNPDITRGPDGNWLDAPGPAIASVTYAELRHYDVGRIRPGSAYASRFPAQQAADGARIPTLAEVFALAREAGDEGVRFSIETKITPLQPERSVTPGAFVQLLLGVIRREGMAGRVTIQSFDWRTLQILQQQAPDIPASYLTAQQDFLDNIQAAGASSPWTAGLHVSRYGGSVPRMVRAAGGAIWSPYYREVTADSVREAQSLGMKVVVWTVNGESAMRRMISFGVDGIISDYPDRLLRVVRGAQ